MIVTRNDTGDSWEYYIDGDYNRIINGEIITTSEEELIFFNKLPNETKFTVEITSLFMTEEQLLGSAPCAPEISSSINGVIIKDIGSTVDSGFDRSTFEAYSHGNDSLRVREYLRITNLPSVGRNNYYAGLTMEASITSEAITKTIIAKYNYTFTKHSFN